MDLIPRVLLFLFVTLSVGVKGLSLCDCV